jgi:hypothetical protein
VIRAGLSIRTQANPSHFAEFWQNQPTFVTMRAQQMQLNRPYITVLPSAVEPKERSKEQGQAISNNGARNWRPIP